MNQHSEHGDRPWEEGYGMKYWRFFAMIGLSTATMFGLMYLNSFSWDHVLFSEMRFWMAFVMARAWR